MTPWLLLSFFLGFSQALSDKSWILTPNVFRCNETEIVLVHSFGSAGTCLKLELKSEKDGTVINETQKVLLIEKKRQFQLGVFNDHCLNDHVYLYITSYEAADNFLETANSECLDITIGKELEYKIPVQKNVGYIFIQTDLPIYHPSETVQIRIFRLNENMYPVNTSVVMTIKDSSNFVIKSQTFYDDADIITTSLKLDDGSQIGVWTISVKYTGKEAPKETNIRFLVHEYVMPKFEIDIDVQPRLISKATKLMNITISATYFYNKTVDGKVYLQYGNNGDSISGKLENGKYFKQVEIKGERCGSFPVSAKVIEKDTRMTEYKTDSMTNFVNSNSVPEEKNELDNRRPKHNELYLKKNSDKEYFMRGEWIEVTAENCMQVHYCIIGRGRIIKCGKEFKHSETSPVYITFNLTEEMIPLAELITYCIYQQRINSTASLNFKVLDVCSQKKQLEMNIMPKKDYYSPQDDITIEIKGYRGQTVGLSVVDDAVHVISNRYRLTTNFVRKKMLSHNLESFSNLKSLKKFRFPHTGYNIHEIQPAEKEVLVVLEKVSLHNQHNLEENMDSLVVNSDLPSAMYQTSILGPKEYKYDNFAASKLYKSYSLSNEDILIVNLTLPDSLTRWHIQAISLSKSSPFCVYEPLPIITFKYIVPQLHIPQYVKKYGMFEIKFILYNYKHQKVKVNITLNKSMYICSKENTMTVELQPSGSSVTKFLAYAMHIGDVPVSVSIEYYDDTEGDRKETIEKIISIKNHQVYKPKILTFFLEETDGFEDAAVTGMTCNERSVLGDIVKTTLQEPEKLMQKSHGSGNQNIIYMAMSVYVLKYILNTKQMSQEIYTNGTKFIRMGMDKLKFFQKNDGSYSSFVDTKSSIWLTAFVLKIFCQASEFEDIDEGLTQQAMYWLLKQQNLDGTFEDSSYVNTDIMGGRSTLELTAFVLISLMECRQIHAREIYENEERIILSMEYLEKNLDHIHDRLTLAITTYALTLTISDKRMDAWERMTNMDRPWMEKNSFKKPSSESVLIASYALLTQLLYDHITIAFPIFNWLIQQKDNNGMFSSTQNTVIALQALAEYGIKWNAPDLDLRLIRPNEKDNGQPNETIDKITFFKRNNSSQGSTDNQIKISSIGVRSTYVQVLTDFNIFNIKEKNCHFAISHSMRKISDQKNISHSLNITLIYNGKTSIQTPVIELDMIRGYYMKNNLMKMVESDSLIEKIEENGESAFTFFLRRIEPGEKLSLNLNLQRVITKNERKLTPSSIRIYNLEKPDESCVILYPKKKYFTLFCHSGECLCPGGCLLNPSKFDAIMAVHCKPNQVAMVVQILYEKKKNLTEEQTQFRRIYAAKIVNVLKDSSGVWKERPEKMEVILDRKCSRSNLKRGKHVLVSDKFMLTEDTNSDKIWIDDYGFILSFGNKNLKEKLNVFVKQINDIGEKSCKKVKR